VSKTEAFANSCDSDARWREEKADEYGDQRSSRAADALHAAATWARTSEEAEEVLAELLPECVFNLGDFLTLSEDGHRIFSTYCFHSAEDLQPWLRRVADAEYGDLFEDDLTDLLDGEQP